MKSLAVLMLIGSLFLMPLASHAAEGTLSIPDNPGAKGDAMDIIGDTVTIGTTWLEDQHWGTVGRMAEKDNFGIVHFAWMNGLNLGGTERHIYYNWIDSLGNQGFPYTGCPVESSLRAGYTTLDVRDEGHACIAFHQCSPLNNNNHTTVAVDFFPCAAAFLTFQPDYLWIHSEDMETLWPNLRINRNGLFHIVSTVILELYETYHVYTVGQYDPSTFALQFPPAPYTWTEVGRAGCDGADVATSEVSDRMAIAWIDPHLDIMVFSDDDGRGLNFDEAFNLTQFTPDDTLRAHTDLSPFIDDQDVLHVAFTTRAWRLPYANASIIWHWSEEYPAEFSVIAEAWDPDDPVNCGAGNVKAQRPSLGQNPQTGFLYCLYQLYDTDSTALSAAGWPSGEVFVSASTDGGLTWSVGTNVTETVTPQGAPADSCLSEVCPCLATLVDENCHIMYVLDRDAGSAIQGERTMTLNFVKYHKVPVELIPAEPLVLPRPFHAEPVSLEMPIVTPEQSRPGGMTVSMTPNPFNPITAISYQLSALSFVNLSVFDVSGRKVAELVNGWRDAGAYEVTFDGSNLASGIYLYRLNAGNVTASGKMVLLK